MRGVCKSENIKLICFVSHTNNVYVNSFSACAYRVPGKLKQFIADLHSGKLHREFHHGPDPAQKQPTIGLSGSVSEQQKAQTNTDPPESQFVKLKPSENRYTLVRDEL